MSRAEDTLDFLGQVIQGFIEKGKSIYMSSSFQTQSVPLLHLVSTNFSGINIVFIDTGYLFAETYAFKQHLERSLALEVVTVSSTKGYSEQQSHNGLQLYSEDTDRCCSINKVEPIDGLVKPGDVWISGVRRDQTAVRSKMKPVEVDARNVTRVHPMLDWNAKDIYDYIREFDLPKHPLENTGYISIGCVPCTHKWNTDTSRGGRWVGQQKTECGLHTENREA